MVFRVAASATDDQFYIRDGTDANGTIKGVGGLQSSEGWQTYNYPNPVSFSTGVFIDTSTTTEEICVQVICAENCT